MVYGQTLSQQYQLIYKDNKKIGATNPGPGNYNSSTTLSKHNPAWKSSIVNLESEEHLGIAQKTMKDLVMATTTLVIPNLGQR